MHGEVAKVLLPYLILQRDTPLPDSYIWDPQAIQKVGRRQPQLLAVDSIYAADRLLSVWMKSPGRPTLLRYSQSDRMVILGGDVTPETPGPPIIKDNMQQYWKEDGFISSERLATIKAISRNTFSRPDVLFLFGKLLHDLYSPVKLDPGISFQNEIALALSFIGMRVPFMGAVIRAYQENLPGVSEDPKLLLFAGKLARGIFPDQDPSVGFRNALVTEKTIEAVQRLGISPEDSAALFGYGHWRREPGAFFDPNLRTRILSGHVNKIFEIYTHRMRTGVEMTDYDDFVASLEAFLGATTLFEITQTEDVPRYQQLNQVIKPFDGFKSTKISAIVDDSAEKYYNSA